MKKRKSACICYSFQSLSSILLYQSLLFQRLRFRMTTIQNNYDSKWLRLTQNRSQSGASWSILNTMWLRFYSNDITKQWTNGIWVTQHAALQSCCGNSTFWHESHLFVDRKGLCVCFHWLGLKQIDWLIRSQNSCVLSQKQWSCKWKSLSFFSKEPVFATRYSFEFPMTWKKLVKSSFQDTINASSWLIKLKEEQRLSEKEQEVQRRRCLTREMHDYRG